jgi:predicted O-methyltransferase YrrM
VNWGSLIRHYLKAGGRYKVHSPHVYDFVTRVLPNQKSEMGNKIEVLRKQLSHSAESVALIDYGAGYGGKQLPETTKTLAAVVKSSARRQRAGELLTRIAAYYKPSSCLELGTNLGFSALYLRAGMSSASTFRTLEGSPQLSSLAEKHFRDFDFTGEFLTGEFSELLSEAAQLQTLRPELVFMDGNHRYQPTMDYFKTIIPHIPDGSLVILDDIHWSGEMEKAWNEIIAMKEVTVSIDLWSLGLCWIRRNQAKEHFKIRWW